MYQGKLDMEYRTRNREGKLGRLLSFMRVCIGFVSCTVYHDRDDLASEIAGGYV